MGEEYNYTAMMDDIDRMNREEEELLFCKLLHSYIYRIEKNFSFDFIYLLKHI